MKHILYCTFLFISNVLIAQDKINQAAEPIVREGKLLYKSEMASWYGTDLFIERCKDKTKIGGYFSYTDSTISKCIFYSKGENPVVIGTISFDSTYSTQAADVNLTERNLTPNEFDLYSIRKLAMDEINSDSLFKVYQNTSLNIIPLIHENSKKVYVLTGPKKSGVVIFGNDYLLTFDKNNKLVNKKKLHNNILPVEYSQFEKDSIQMESAVHSHLPETGDYITATDICTIMLYSKFAKWKSYSVISKKYYNHWDCKSNSLFVVPMKTIQKINNHQDKLKKKNKKNNESE